VKPLAHELHVAFLDVAPVLAKVHGDSIGASRFRQQSGFDRIRDVHPPRLAHGCDMVHIHSEANQSFTPISVRI
jgi:hypothetical protein